MSVFTEHLRFESQLIQSGLSLLDAYRSDLQNGRLVHGADLRMAAYALQLATENAHLTKMESILFPVLDPGLSLTPEHDKIRLSMLQLRIGIDRFQANPETNGTLIMLLSEYVSKVKTYLEVEEIKILSNADQVLDARQQQRLLDSAQSLEATQRLEKLRGPRLIIDRLRLARGMSAAS